MTEDFGEIIELLNVYKHKDMFIDNIKNEIEELEISKKEIYDIKGNYSDGMPKGSNISDISDRVLKVIDIYDKRIDNLKLKILKINNDFSICVKLLNSLEPIEYNIVFDFYIKKVRWDFVSKKNAYSIRHCKRIRDKAFRKMSYLYKNKFKNL